MKQITMYEVSTLIVSTLRVSTLVIFNVRPNNSKKI